MPHILELSKADLIKDTSREIKLISVTTIDFLNRTCKTEAIDNYIKSLPGSIINEDEFEKLNKEQIEVMSDSIADNRKTQSIKQMKKDDLSDDQIRNLNILMRASKSYHSGIIKYLMIMSEDQNTFSNILESFKEDQLQTMIFIIKTVAREKNLKWFLDEDIQMELFGEVQTVKEVFALMKEHNVNSNEDAEKLGYYFA